jgi:hypothetical protein
MTPFTVFMGNLLFNKNRLRLTEKNRNIEKLMLKEFKISFIEG